MCVEQPRWRVVDVSTAVVAVAIVVVVVVFALVLRRRRNPDPVDSFRRQIDALSPEARRPTIDRGRASDDPADQATVGDADSDEEDADDS